MWKSWYTQFPNKNIYCYSFALKPEEHQPSGSCNFSRLDSFSITVNYTPVAVTITNGVDARPLDISIYGIGYNILRIISGMAGTAYTS